MRDASEKLRMWVIAEPLEPRCLLSVDVTPPTVRFVLHSFMTAPQWIAVTYRDETDLNFRSANRTDIRVTGPNGFSAIADHQGLLSTGWSISSPYRLKYGIPAPGGSWDPADNGRYKISLTRPVEDARGNRVRNLKLGSFDVLLSGMGRAQGYVAIDDPRPMEGVRVYVDANDDSVFNSGELSVLSNRLGAYVFAELPLGNYRIREVVPTGHQLLKSLPPGASMDDAGTGGFFDITVSQSTITDVGSFINSLIFLDVSGTANDDQITVEPDALGVKVTINGVAQVHNSVDFNGLRVRGGEGNDQITIDPGVLTVARIYGDEGTDTLRGGGGNSTLSGGHGRDLIFGGAGNDTIGGGNDLVPSDQDEGDDGADTIHGNDGNDNIFGGRGNDLIFGDGGNDLIQSGSGAATIRGGEGNDNINCEWSIGQTELHGDAGNDRLEGGSLNDLLFGEAGNDMLIGGGHKDTLFGGSGDDVLHSDWSDVPVHGDSFGEVLDGGPGTDKAFVDSSDKLMRVERVRKLGTPASCPLLICAGDGCFLTTAVANWAGKADDCHELMVLRQFRDGYMRQLREGPQMIRDYYQHAPRVVHEIEQQQRGEEEWPRVYAMVREAVELIEAGRNREALELYATEYLRLKAEYVQAAVV